MDMQQFSLKNIFTLGKSFHRQQNGFSKHLSTTGKLSRNQMA
jgi:hypothetical protein